MVIHSDEVEPRIIDGTQLRGTRLAPGARRPARRAPGSAATGSPPGERAMPVHVHADEEELFYVLDGEGLSWQDGRAYAVGAGDCILHRAERRGAHASSAPATASTCSPSAAARTPA